MESLVCILPEDQDIKFISTESYYETRDHHSSLDKFFWPIWKYASITKPHYKPTWTKTYPECYKINKIQKQICRTKLNCRICTRANQDKGKLNVFFETEESSICPDCWWCIYDNLTLYGRNENGFSELRMKNDTYHIYYFVYCLFYSKLIHWVSVYDILDGKAT